MNLSYTSLYLLIVSEWYVMTKKPSRSKKVASTRGPGYTTAINSTFAKLRGTLLFDILETFPFYICLIDKDYKILFANKSFRDTFGCADTRPCYNFLFNRDKPCDTCEMSSVRTTQKIRNKSWTCPNGRVYDVYDYPLTDAKGTVLVLKIGIDITEQISAVAELVKTKEELEDRVKERTANLMSAYASLAASERSLATSQEIAHLGSWEYDIINNKDTWSDEAYRILGVMPQEFPATYELFLQFVHPDDRTAVESLYTRSLQENKDHYEVEHRIVQKNTGEIRVVHEKCDNIRDKSGRIIKSIGMMHDITDRKRIEDKLREKNEILMAANEKIMVQGEDLMRNNEELTIRKEELSKAFEDKEALLQEIHHRVKNNLTAFISLLDLEGAQDTTPAGIAIKTDLQNRARSMALIHETLYRTHNFSEVEMDVYFSTLVNQIVNSYGSIRSLTATVNAQNIKLDLSRATPLGLIVNELVTNSLKYAFPSSVNRYDVPPTIIVSLNHQEKNYNLTVKDNGIGLPKGFNLPKTDTLGLKLVYFLAKHQLKANITAKTDGGAASTLVFNDTVK
jgi:PAS domain S-box-containing protein